MTIHMHTFTGSSMLSNCTYDSDSEELAVTFNGGKTYTYVDVSRRTYDELIEAKSAGKYFNNIKGQLEQKK